jgi:hypothetical protein
VNHYSEKTILIIYFLDDHVNEGRFEKFFFNIKIVFSSSRDRSSSPVEKARDRSSRSPSKDEIDDKKEGNKNDNDKSVTEKPDQDENDESHSSPTAGETEMKNDDDD